LIGAVFSLTPAVGGAAGPRIGVVDVQRVLKESREVQKVRDNLLQDMKAKRETLAAKEREVRNKEEEFRKLPPKTPAKQRAAKADELKNALRDLQYLRQDLEAEWKRKENDAMRTILGEVLQLIRKHARDEGYTTVLDSSAVLASDEGVDITNRIIRLYDESKR